MPSDDQREELMKKAEKDGPSFYLNPMVSLCSILWLQLGDGFITNMFLLLHRLQIASCRNVQRLRQALLSLSDMSTCSSIVPRQIKMSDFPIFDSPQFSVILRSCCSSFGIDKLHEDAAEYLLRRACSNVTKKAMILADASGTHQKLGNNLARLLRFVVDTRLIGNWEDLVSTFDATFAYKEGLIGKSITEFMEWMVFQYKGDDPDDITENVIKASTLDEYGRVSIRVIQVVHEQFSISRQARIHDPVSMEAMAAMKIGVKQYSRQHGNFAFAPRYCLSISFVLEILNCLPSMEIRLLTTDDNPTTSPISNCFFESNS